MMPPILSVDIRRQLSKFELRTSFELDRPDEILALLGPSGCGKSMTLKCIAGIERPDSGRIVLGDRVLFDSNEKIDLKPQERHVGYLFQSYALFPNMTVLQNVMSGAAGASRSEREARARAELSRMRLDGIERQRPTQLSGGQQQRVAMARILASDPELILLDEPFSALDGHLRWQLEMELADTLKGFPGGALFVSHNRDEVYRMCDSVCVISEGKSDPKVSVPQLFSAPGTLAAALISGCKNVSPVAVTDDFALSSPDWGVTLATDRPVSSNTTHVGVRAHYMRLAREGSDAPNLVECEVDRVIQSTFSTIAMLRTPGGGLLRFECQKDEWAALGGRQRVVVELPPSAVMPLVDSLEPDAAEGR